MALSYLNYQEIELHSFLTMLGMMARRPAIPQI